MTGQEFAQFVLEVNATFRGEKIGGLSQDDAQGEARLASYRTHLGGLEYASAQGALRLLVEDGQVFVPTPGEVMSATRRLTTPASPSWVEAWPMIRRALMRRGPLAHVGLYEPLQGFVLAYGADRLSHEPVEDPHHGGAVLARIGKEYEAFVERWEDGARVERARLAGGGLRRLDPARDLP